MEKKGRLLIIDDNEELLIALKLFLNPHFSEIQTEKTPNIIPSIHLEQYDLILLDMNFSAGINTGNEGFYWMKEILKRDPAACIVFITAYSDVELAVKAMKEGAADFIQKSWDEHKILSTVLSAYKLRQSKLEIKKLKNKQKLLSSKLNQDYQIVKGTAETMRALYQTIEKVSGTNANILILGENGTGKEVIAREIHRLSDRREEIFVNVDLGAINENLFESELFGHLKGSFTDAKEDRAGRFEIANGGTLFLDEIGNLSLSLQAKLLSVIQNQEIFRIGSSTPISIDIRLICATNKNIEQMVSDNTFREDLLYRINTIQLDVPPLRDRIEDIQILANSFLEDFKKKYNRHDLKLSASALKQLEKHRWPGNIRELKHSIEKAVIMADENSLKAKDFFMESKPEKTIEDDYNLAENEKKIIEKALAKHKGNMSITAQKLGINRSTLYDKIKKYGI